MRTPGLEPSAELAALREAHRAERAPEVLRRRSLQAFDARWAQRARSPETGERPLGSAWRRSLGSFAAAACGALVLWLFARAASSPSLLHAGGSAPEHVARPAQEEPQSAEASRGAVAGGAARKLADRRRCPLAELPGGALVEPSAANIDVVQMSLSVHTFDVVLPRCGPLTRRYLALEGGLSPRSDAPILMLLHDAGRSAEDMRVLDTRWYFEALARERGVLLVYANAAPSAGMRPGVLNSGIWQTDEGSHPLIDDVAYLELIVDDLKRRAVISGDNEVWLVGHGSAGTMALTAASRRPDVYSGVAALLPDGFAVAPPSGGAHRLSRVLFVTRGEPSQAWGGTDLQAAAEQWAHAVGGAQRAAPGSVRVRFTGASGYDRLDLTLGTSPDAAVRVLMLEAGSDLFPLPGAADRLSLEAARRRPQFIDGAEQLWMFFNGER